MKRKAAAVLRCRQMLARLSDYLDGELPPSLCERLERHLDDCPPCVVFVATLKKTIGSVKAVGRSGRVPASARRSLSEALRACAKRLPKRL